MNFQKALIKPSMYTFLLYIVLTVTCSIVLNLVWQATLPTFESDFETLAGLAESSKMLSIGSAVIGVFATILCAAVVTVKTNRENPHAALYFAVWLILYGVLSIALHPEHTLIQQVGKLVAPIPLALIGAWLVQQTPKT